MSPKKQKRSSWGPSLQMSDFEPGCILHLRSQEELSPSQLGMIPENHRGALRHPCVVLEKLPPSELSDGGRVRIVALTSFGGHSLQEKYKKIARWMDCYLPVEPCPPNPRRPKELLRLVDGVQMRRSTSYVKVDETYTVSPSMLDLHNQDYAANHFRFDETSFITVKNEVARYEKHRKQRDRDSSTGEMSQSNVQSEAVQPRPNAHRPYLPPLVEQYPPPPQHDSLSPTSTLGQYTDRGDPVAVPGRAEILDVENQISPGGVDTPSHELMPGYLKMALRALLAAGIIYGIGVGVFSRLRAVPWSSVLSWPRTGRH